MIYILLILYVICTVGGLILFKYGANQKFLFEVSNKLLHFELSIYSIIGLILYVISFILYIFIIAKFEITYILPFISIFTSIGITFLAIIILKESMTVFKLLGIITILIGGILLNIKK